VARAIRISAWILLAILALPACRPARRAAPDSTVSTAGAPGIPELKQATYLAIAPGEGPVTLKDGVWEGAPYEAGGASRPSVRLVEDLLLAGDLTGDGVEDAVALLTADAGGTGVMSYLALMSRKKGQVTNLASATVGDRVQIRAARIVAGQLVVDVVQPGPNDPMCCPGDLATRRWKYADGKLQESAPVLAGRLSPDALAGREWILTHWSRELAAPAGPPVTLLLAEGTIRGSSGCNNYVAAFKAGASPSDITFGPTAGTRMMCDAAAMTVEDRFLAQLAAVRSFSFVAGKLVLNYETHGTPGSMVFAARVSR